jgi:hypothetical protein
MATARQDRQIGQFLYTVQQLPATRSLRLLHRLGKVLGPGLTQAASLGSVGSLANADVGVIVSGIAGILQTSAEDEVVGIVRDLLGTTFVTQNGQMVELAPLMDLHFQGNLLDLFKVVAFALEVNYGDFFGGLLAGGRAKLAAAAPSPNPSA